MCSTACLVLALACALGSTAQPSLSVATLLTGSLQIASEEHLTQARAALEGMNPHVATYAAEVFVAQKLAQRRERVVLVAPTALQSGVLAACPTSALQWFFLDLALRHFALDVFDFVVRWRVDLQSPPPRPEQLALWLGHRTPDTAVVLAWSDRAFAARADSFRAAYGDMFAETCGVYLGWPLSADSCPGIGAARSWRHVLPPGDVASYEQRARPRKGCADSGWDGPRHWRHETECGCGYDGLDACPWRHPDPDPKPFHSETAHTFHLARRGVQCLALVTVGRLPSLAVHSRRHQHGMGLEGAGAEENLPRNLTAYAIHVVDAPLFDCGQAPQARASSARGLRQYAARPPLRAARPPAGASTKPQDDWAWIRGTSGTLAGHAFWKLVWVVQPFKRQRAELEPVRVFSVFGSESSGTKLVARTLAQAAGVVGFDEWDGQAMVSDGRTLVQHISLPWRGACRRGARVLAPTIDALRAEPDGSLPSLSRMFVNVTSHVRVLQARWPGANVTAVLVMRDEGAAMSGKLRRVGANSSEPARKPHCDDPETAQLEMDHAKELLAHALARLAAPAEVVVVSYEALVLLQGAYMQYVYSQLGLRGATFTPNIFIGHT